LNKSEFGLLLLPAGVLFILLVVAALLSLAHESQSFTTQNQPVAIALESRA
jgi:hypothetical protein